jgi:energy-coupling factor transport system ATP-binding protein
LRPGKGKIYIAGRELNYAPQELKEIRKRIGFLFQYPEHQLFGKNVFEDVSFALTRHKELPPSAIKEKVRAACALVGLEDENFWNRSPGELSRGEMRRAALAGILVQNPQVLILDEPTVGLDAQGKKEILAWIKTFHKEGRTVIIIAHDVEEILDLVDRLIVLDQGQILTVGTPEEVFSHLWRNQKFTFLIPPLYQLILELRDKGRSVPAGKWRNEEIIDFYLAQVRRPKRKNIIN